ncbi:Cancer-related nucleoside-triphosphatase-like [Vitis vinifera]|uniref:Cancer-related nucleoside-triphosphatase-like n=1 Tax=Vitis vinifera TaxID=29760 RepID=A0A438HMM0_VITVI|nr:Cancer-related nucleoside-triphosphatase-like [Vitis vinifera]
MAGPGKCFLVTGPPGVGKTTLITRVLETLKISNPNLKVQGFYTSEVREASERVGFQVVTLDGRKGPLASSISSPESLRWPSVGKYRVDIASFEALALPELQVKEDTDLFIIDEVGKMELFSSSFFPAVLRVLESNIPVWPPSQFQNSAEIYLEKSPHLLCPLHSIRQRMEVARLRNHPGATIFTLNTGNRDFVKEQIYSQLRDLLQKH